MGTFAGQVALVTGGGGGIGGAVSQALFEAGARVVCADLAEPKGPADPRFRPAVLDVCRGGDVRRLVNGIVASEGRIDLLVNVAGVACLDGACFGQFGTGYLRFSYANSMKNLEEALERIRKFIVK